MSARKTRIYVFGCLQVRSEVNSLYDSWLFLITKLFRRKAYLVVILVLFDPQNAHSNLKSLKGHR